MTKSQNPPFPWSKVCCKIATLTAHFPKLRILWSKSPHETLRIFKALKANHEEVDVAKAVDIGKNDSLESLLKTDRAEGGGENEIEIEEDEINEAGRDMLLQLPGVTIQLARRIMQECDCLADLIAMSRDQLRALAGPSTGQKLFT
mmetsp:Transcript_18452/g.42390  ORF Transcript_18452/g.42390 Transcript_18452/m.42390 type:complete len:146 (+) Transcript_18452:3815-4252(+)